MTLNIFLDNYDTLVTFSVNTSSISALVGQQAIITCTAVNLIDTSAIIWSTSSGAFYYGGSFLGSAGAQFAVNTTFSSPSSTTT